MLPTTDQPSGTARSPSAWARRSAGARRDDAADAADIDAGYLRSDAADPETLLLRASDGRMVNELVAGLPTGFREVIVLRELEDMPYREIADVVGIPVGTVMSRIARGRALLRKAWIRRQTGEP